MLAKKSLIRNQASSTRIWLDLAQEQNNSVTVASVMGMDFDIRAGEKVMAMLPQREVVPE
jgi:hypothetical protein